MTDDRFRLTALDARRWDFGSALRGFDRTRVHAFRDQVAEELETMARANQELETKVNNFLEQLRVFRERDKALNEALVSAQQLRGEIRSQAEREAQLIVREARGEAERIVASARAEVERAEGELQSLWRTRQAFLVQMRTLVERQATEISAAAQVEPPVAFSARGSSPAASESTSGVANRVLTPEVDAVDAVVATRDSRDAAPSPAGALADSPDVQDALDALNEALESDVNSLETFAPRSRKAAHDETAERGAERGAEGGGERGGEASRNEQPMRPSMPTPSWLGVVADEDKSR